MSEIVEHLLDKDVTIAEYSSGKGTLHDSTIKKDDGLFGAAEDISVKVAISIIWSYNESSHPSEIQTFSKITGNISKLTIYDSVLKSRLGKEKREKIYRCLHGISIDGYKNLPQCTIYMENLKDYTENQSFEAVIEGVVFIILLPSIKRIIKNKNEHFLTLKNVFSTATDISRKEAHQDLNIEGK